jgi:hypothetical protein
MNKLLLPASDQALASMGWLVEVNTGTDEHPDLRWLAVTIPNAADAEREVLRFPGLLESDRRTAKRPLSLHEISQMKLMAGAVRPYKCNLVHGANISSSNFAINQSHSAQAVPG